mgnify:CR=1 FL=1|jgi:outer membrane protein OmpA-like peptidoglycan-associated protein
MLMDQSIYLGVINPIPGKYPAGCLMDEDPNYRLVQTELSKLGGLRQETICWERVQHESLHLLTTKTKDIHCLTGLLMGLMSVGSDENIILALISLEGFLQKWHQDGFPYHDAEGRKVWANRLNQIVRRLRPLLEEREFIRQDNGLEEARTGLRQLATTERWLSLTGVGVMADSIRLVDPPPPPEPERKIMDRLLPFRWGFISGILLISLMLAYWFLSVNKSSASRQTDSSLTAIPLPLPAPVIDGAACEDNLAVIMSKQSSLFDSGSQTLTPAGEVLVKQVASLLTRQCSQTLVRVEGHTDTVGDEDENLRISQQRADAVAHLLVKEGVLAKRLTMVGYGSRRPLMDNITPEGRSRNRRIEIRLSLPETLKPLDRLDL